MPAAVGKAWAKSFVKELSGILVSQCACILEDPRQGDNIIPVMEVFKCKLDKDGCVDKLKCRIVFRGDLYDPADMQDLWSLHAFFPGIEGI